MADRAQEREGEAEGEADDVRRFRERLGLPGLVDVHTHFMPEQVLKKVWAYFDAVGPLTGMEWPIATGRKRSERLALLREFGVRAFTSMLYPHKAGMAEWLNRWAVDFAARTPDCLHTSTFFPEPGVAAYVRKAVEGARGSSRRTSRSGRTTRTTNCSTGVGDARRGRGPRGHALRVRARPGKHTGPGAGRPAARPASAAAADRRAHGDAGVRGLPRPGRAVRRGAARHDDGVHRLQ